MLDLPLHRTAVDQRPPRLPRSVMGKEGTRVFVIQSVRQTSVPMHTHAYFELAFILRGNAVHRRGDDWYQVRPEDLLLVNPVIPHGYSVVEGKEVHIININFVPSALGDALCDPHVATMLASFISPQSCSNAGRPGFFRGTAPEVQEIVSQMLQEQCDQNPGFEVVLDSLLRALLVQLYRTRVTREVPNHDELSAVKAVLEVVPEIHKMACSDDVSVRRIADMAGLSYGYFGKQFKSVMGETVLEYVQRIRIFSAAQLLCTTDAGVDVIAGKVGYRDVPTFRSVFKRLMGTTPSEYRFSGPKQPEAVNS